MIYARMKWARMVASPFGYGKRQVDSRLVDRSIAPRLAQIFVPLLSVIEDTGAREAL